MRGSCCMEAFLDRLQHHIAHVRAGDARIGNCRPGNDLAVEGIDDESETNDLSIPAGELQTVRAPAQVGSHNHDLAVMDAALANGGMLLQQHGMVAHDAMDPFGVDDRPIGGSPFAIEERGDPPIAVGRPLIHQPANGGQKLCILDLVVWPTRL
ncbi:hypothetical protein D3C81_1475810 [compost metagenome]